MLEYLHSSSRTSAGDLNQGLYSALVNQADSEESASRAVLSRDTAVAMAIISCEWAVHKLNLHLTSQICQFGEL